MSTLRLLIRPTLFTVGVCGTCYCGAVILNHEYRPYSRVSVAPAFKTWTYKAQQHQSNLTQQFIALRKRVNNWANDLSTGHKIAGGTIFVNLLVLCAWRSKSLQPLMNTFFLSQAIPNTKVRLAPMILSCFSHSMPLHFAFNMYALYSFSNFAVSLLGPEQLIGLFISAGTVSSLTSIAYRLATKKVVPSLGASGAILGVVAYICVVSPQTELLLFFVPISAGNAIKALMAIDVVGLIARWRYIDHAAHLGGTLFGVWYGYYGNSMYYKYRRQVLEKWSSFKRRLE